MALRPGYQAMIDYLNGLCAVDPGAMGALLRARVHCGDAMASLPDGPAGGPEGEPTISFLGVVNGFYGTYDEGVLGGYGPITAVLESDGSCTGFKVTSESCNQPKAEPEA